MKAVISSTYNDTYLFFLPITTWAWNKLGVDVICFMPKTSKVRDMNKMALIHNNFPTNNQIHLFDCPEDKEATYAQCSRLYAGGIEEMPNDEQLIVSDIDMAVFSLPPMLQTGFTVFGFDLVPKDQYPMCYISARAEYWRKVFGDIPYQKSLDNLLGDIECENMRGNYWSKDQQEAHTKLKATEDVYVVELPRSNGQNQFAQNRLDRDDAYILERDVTGVMDYHMNRPGFEHIETIITIFEKVYPFDNFNWMREYAAAYKALL